MADLFDLTDLAVWLDSDLKLDMASLVRDKVTALVASEVRIPDPVPAGLSALAVSIAARIYDNPLGYTNESFAGYSAGYAQATLTADEKTALRRFALTGVRGVAGSSRMCGSDFPRVRVIDAGFSG